MEPVEFILVNIVLPLVIGGIGAYAYPRIEGYLKNRSLSNRERKLFSILHRYYQIRAMKQKPEYLDSERFIAILRGMLWFSFFAVSCVLLILSYLILPNYSDMIRTIGTGGLTISASFTLFTFWFLTSRYRRETYDVVYFESYKEETAAKIKSLGGNPEELDKEENNKNQRG